MPYRLAIPKYLNNLRINLHTILHECKLICNLLVTPARFELAISGVKGRRPGPLDDGAMLEMKAGFEPANNSFADCPLKPLGHFIIWLR